MKSITPAQLLAEPVPQSTAQRILRFPLVELVVVILFMVPVALAHNLVVEYFLEGLSDPLRTYIGYLEKVINFALFLLAYRLYTRWVEKRKALEISFAGSIQETGVGFAIGGGLIVLMVALMSVLGYYSIDSFDQNSRVVLDAFFARGIGAFIEELLFRVIIFRLIEELLGTWYALVLVAMFFGLAHFPNENATLWTSAAIAISDILLTAAFVLTRRLWIVWGIHFGWNYLMDAIFGLPNSGITQLDSWITPVVTGPEWLTGGSFGIEASYVAVTIQLVIGLWLLKLAHSKGQLLAPMWRRTPAAPVASL